MDCQQAQRQLTSDLTPLYGSREAALIADWVMENLTGQKRIHRLAATGQLTDTKLKQYDIYRSELLHHRPVQYVLQESWFAGRRFYVDENVLIPRPETEELVEWVLETIGHYPESQTGHSPDSLLDVGTGSGCIPITLQLKIPSLDIHACDISNGALGVANRNADALNASITFHHLDFLDRNSWRSLPPVKWLVSNPPYIPLAERSTLAPHVAGSEPGVALFVPDQDPLVFYHALAAFAAHQLISGGAVWVETHEARTAGVAAVFRSAGAVSVETRKDVMGKDRMVKAMWQ